MEKLILKKITLVVSIIFIFVSLLNFTSIIFTKNRAVYEDLSEMISQVENSYEESQLNIELTKEIFEDDYLNRAYAIDYILNNNPNYNLNNESLDKIKELMEVESVYVVDKNGVIALSSDDDSIGINLLNYREPYPFWDLIQGKDEDGKVVQFDAVSIAKKKEKIYVGVESTLEQYSLIQIGLERSALNDLIKVYSIDSIISSSPSIYEQCIFAVNKTTGNIDGITKNNDQDLAFEDVNTKGEFLKKLYDLTDGKVEKVNNKYRYIKTRIVGDYIIGAYIDANTVYNTIFADIVCLAMIMILVFLSIIIIIKYYIKEYMLNDLTKIEKDIKKIVDGNHDIEFNTKYDTELKEVTKILNYWKDSYKYKSDRMVRILSTLNTHSAIFECIYAINKNFFTDNIKEILGLDDETWEKISKKPEDFENYINSINAKEGIVNINNKFLEIVSFKKEYEFYGMIIDKTDEEEFKNEIKKKSETDPLTKLLNRSGLESRIQNIFEEDKDGTLIIFDLDNFKRVNDELGHPVGDEVLKIFSKCLVSSFEKSDIISRMGGDEFIVFINEKIEVDNLSNKLEQILNKIRNELKVYYENYGLSTSIGVAYKNETNNTYEKLYEKADQALYKAKNSGKDRVCMEGVE